MAPLLVAAAEQQPRALPAQSSPAAQLQAAQALMPVAPAMAASSAAADAPAYYALSITQRTDNRNADGVLLTSQTMRPEPIRVEISEEDGHGRVAHKFWLLVERAEG